ncbi:hypothetical protein PG995_012812 [Apiospora arundinis]
MYTIRHYICLGICVLFFCGFTATAITLSIVLPKKLGRTHERDYTGEDISDFCNRYGNGNGNHSSTAATLGRRGVPPTVIAATNLSDFCSTFHTEDVWRAFAMIPVTISNTAFFRVRPEIHP